MSLIDSDLAENNVANDLFLLNPFWANKHFPTEGIGWLILVVNQGQMLENNPT
jgi:hypothetical protein